MTIATKSPVADPEVDLSATITGEPFSIGTGFTAKSFRQNRFDGLMDPFVMLDHYTMSEPTFGAHPHAGMSAVSILFEDSEGRFNNRDSLGNDIDLMPGDLYWLKAGRGAVHDEAPRPGSRTHGLQVFVNLPARMKHDTPASLHVASDSMPVVTADGVRVRVMLGQSNEIAGATSPALPLTVLDMTLDAGARYAHTVPAGETVLLVGVNGHVRFEIDGNAAAIGAGQAIAVNNRSQARTLTIRSAGDAHLALLQGAPVGERFVQRGPFVMSTVEEIEAVSEAYAAGELGHIDQPAP